MTSTNQQEKPVLLLQGLGMFEPSNCFVSKAFKTQADAKNIPYVSVAFDEDESQTSGERCASAIAEAHEKYRAIVVADFYQPQEEGYFEDFEQEYCEDFEQDDYFEEDDNFEEEDPFEIDYVEEEFKDFEEDNEEEEEQDIDREEDIDIEYLQEHFEGERGEEGEGEEPSGDDAWNNNIHDYLANYIKKYITEEKGCVIFAVSEGLTWCNGFLKTHFGEHLDWTGVCYYREVHRAVQSNFDNIRKFFGVDAFHKRFSIKSCMLSNVPVHQRCFEEEEYNEEEHDNDGGSPCPVAVASGGSLGGTLAYFGDVNAQEETHDLITEMLLRCPNFEMVQDDYEGNLDDDSDHDNEDTATAVECKICLANMKPHQQISQILPCGHQFHSSCIVKWRQMTCPICRGTKELVRKLTLGTVARTEWPKYKNNGTVCKLVGLIARPELNGREGIIERFLFTNDGQNERYAVTLLPKKQTAGEERPQLLDDTGSDLTITIKIKETNLEFSHTLRFDLAQVQELIDACPIGGRCVLPTGTYKGSDDNTALMSLLIKKPVILDGRHSNFQFPVKSDIPKLNISDCKKYGASAKKLVIKDVSIFGSVHLKGPFLENVKLMEVTINCPESISREDALYLDGLTDKKSSDISGTGHILVDKCKIVGGSDGVNINSPCVLIRNSEIRNAKSRGMFVSRCCTVENITIQGCGGYGMKTRAGVRRIGHNNIQPGPWDSSPWNSDW